MKKSFYLFLFFFCILICINGAPKKTDFVTYNQIIENQTDGVVVVKVLNEETHAYNEYTIEPNSSLEIPEVISLKQESTMKRLIIMDKDVYNSSKQLIGPNQWHYILKSTKPKKNPYSEMRKEDYLEDGFEDDDFDPEYYDRYDDYLDEDGFIDGDYYIEDNSLNYYLIEPDMNRAFEAPILIY